MDTHVPGGVLLEPHGHLAGGQYPPIEVDAGIGLDLVRCAREGREEALAQRRELQRVEHGVDLLPVEGRVERELGRVVRQIEIAHQRVQPTVPQHVVEVVAQRLSRLARDLVDPIDDRLEAAVRVDPLGRRLGSDAGNPRKIVTGLADQGGDVGVELRQHAVLLLDRDRRHPREVRDPLARVEDRDVVADELQRVAVPGADQDLHALGLGAGRQRRDDVVGLEAVLVQVSDVERVQHLLDQLDLPGELGGRARPVGLVVGVLLGAERPARLVEGDAHVRGLLVSQHVDEHRGEPEDRVRALSRGGGEVLDRQREEGTVRHRMSVDQQESAHGSTLVGRADTVSRGGRRGGAATGAPRAGDRSRASPTTWSPGERAACRPRSHAEPRSG